MRDSVKEFITLLQRSGHSVEIDAIDDEKIAIRYPVLTDVLTVDFSGKDPTIKDYVAIEEAIRDQQAGKLHTILNALAFYNNNQQKPEE